MFYLHRYCSLSWRRRPTAERCLVTRLWMVPVAAIGLYGRRRTKMGTSITTTRTCTVTITMTRRRLDPEWDPLHLVKTIRNFRIFLPSFLFFFEYNYNLVCFIVCVQKYLIGSDDSKIFLLEIY